MSSRTPRRAFALPVARPNDASRRPGARAARRPRRRQHAAGLAIGLMAACGGDPLAPNSSANVDTQETVFRVYPLSAATGPLPTAVNVVGLAVVQPALTTVALGQAGVIAPNFDFAVDRGADGRVRLLPAKLVAGLGGAGLTLETGFRVVAGDFAAIAAAPDGTYQADSVTTVNVGQVVVVEAQALACYGRARPNVYAKLVVDSVSAPSGLVFLRARVNPNCGFRSLQPGKPTS
jgi:hypothetical protein